MQKYMKCVKAFEVTDKKLERHWRKRQPAGTKLPAAVEPQLRRHSSPNMGTICRTLEINAVMSRNNIPGAEEEYLIA